jgi:hypothetical protein
MRSLAVYAAAVIIFSIAGVGRAQSDRGFVGISAGEVPAAVRQQGISGALVQAVESDGPADQAGVKRNDIVVSIHGDGVAGPQAMKQMAAALQPGQEARIEVLRWNGYRYEKHTFTLTTGSSPTQGPASPAAPGTTGAQAKPPSLPARESMPPADVKFTRFTDPLEQAFSAEVPAGWRSEGGLARSGMIQINPYLRVLSPDKMTYLMMGEPTLPSYAPLTQLGVQLGFKEGTLYSAGLGQQVLIMHYMPGAEFARAYGLTALGNICPALKFVSGKERPDLAHQAEVGVPTVIPSTVTGGEAQFTCTHNKQEMEGRIEAATRITRDNIGWAVIWLQGFVAPKGQADRAQAILSHILSTTVWDPKWTQMQNNLSQQAGQAISQRIAGYERQQAAFMQKLNSVDENFTAMDELISGNSHYHDARTGQDYLLNNLNPFKWIDDSGRILGTQSNIKPPWGTSYRSLTQVTQ